MTSSVRRLQPRTRLDAVRQTAYAALRAVDETDAYLNLALARLLSERNLAGRDAALATELAHGTARMQGSYDCFLENCVKGGVAALQSQVLTALRLGAHQLLNMRVPDHAAVGTSVELVREAVGERPVRLVNAVLRRISAQSFDQWVESTAPAREADLIGHLTVRHSHPRWVVDAYLAALGDVDQVEALLVANNRVAEVALVVRPGLIDVETLCRQGAVVDNSAAGSVRRGRWSPYAAILQGGDPAGLAAVRSGTAGVQDEGSQLAAWAASRAAVDGRDTRWLDLCAGPGGKAALLTGLARERGAALIAAERRWHRAQLVASALRAYEGGSSTVVADGTSPPWRSSSFDRAIADVPCTGLGALRRRPESRWRRQPADLPNLIALQQDLLNSALDSVRVGGVVTYVTCSPHLAETRGVVDAVSAARGDVEELDARAVVGDIPNLGPGLHAQLWPHLHGTDAMFIAQLRRQRNRAGGGGGQQWSHCLEIAECGVGNSIMNRP